jgi:hypothetical protein
VELSIEKATTKVGVAIIIFIMRAEPDFRDRFTTCLIKE